MKYRKRSAICAMVAGLIALISSCSAPIELRLELLEHKVVKDFPSASAIEFDSNRLYIFGDDAPYLMIMDTAYNRLDTVLYSIDTSYRILKSVKDDIESATIIATGNEKHLYAMGSLSADSRSKLFYFPLSDPNTYLSIDYLELRKKLMQSLEPNIEGLAFVKSKLVMANRANNTHRTNTLIISDGNPKDPGHAIHMIQLLIDSSTIKGVSGLYYDAAQDLLLFTASEEETASATADGDIKDSYLGVISRFSIMMDEKTLKPDALVNLTTVDSVFIKQKVESVCIQRSDKDNMIIHLVADNDNGESTLFRLRLFLK